MLEKEVYIGGRWGEMERSREMGGDGGFVVRGGKMPCLIWG